MSSVTESPYKKATDSPSRQLLWELAQLHLNDRTSFYAKLEEDARDRENQHRAALAAAAAEHDRIRQRAEIERERLQIQMDKEIARREARQRKLLDTQKRLTAEKSLKEEQKALARAQALEDENRKIAEIAKAKVEAQRKAQEAQAEIDAAKKAQQDQEDAARAAARKAVEDAQRRKREEATKSAAQSALLSSSTIATIPTAPAATNLPRTQNSIQPTRVPGFAPPAGKQATSSIGSLTGHLKPERVAEHDRYLDIHKNLKVLRKAVAEEGKSNKSFKTAIGDSRRTIRKCVGQITDVKGANQKPVSYLYAYNLKSLTLLLRSMKLETSSRPLPSSRNHPCPSASSSHGPPTTYRPEFPPTSPSHSSTSSTSSPNPSSPNAPTTSPYPNTPPTPSESSS